MEERTTIPPVTDNTGKKGKSHKTQVKGNGEHVDVVETEQPQLSETASTVSYPFARHRVLLENSRALQAWTRGSWV